VGIPVLLEESRSLQAAVSLRVRAWGLAEAGGEQITELRSGLSGLGPGLAASVLKHADPQTIVALAALRQALTDSALSPEDFSGWGVVGCPREPGRAWMTEQLVRFAAEGAWSVSPHAVPHCSLHSLSGLLSQALATHGPNLGVGGRPGLEAQALRAAVALLADSALPGVWVVWTGWHPEPFAEAEECSPICRALALALQDEERVTVSPGMVGRGQPLCLRLTPPLPSAAESRHLPLFSLEGLATALPHCPSDRAAQGLWRGPHARHLFQGGQRAVWRLGDGGRLFLVGAWTREGGSR
jgi:hypothetical protein